MADNGAATTQQEMEHQLLMAKITAMIVMFLITALVGSVPFMLDRCFKWTTTNKDNPRTTVTVRCLLQFGGGVLLCTTFVHLLPEVEGICSMLEYCGIVPPLGFALAETLMCAGFFLMYIIEECVHACLRSHQQKLQAEANALAAFERGHSVRNSRRMEESDADSVRTVPTNSPSTNVSPCCSVVDVAEFNVKPAQPAAPKPQPDGHGHSHLPADISAEVTVTAALRGLLLVFALSIHELFEGMSIGLEQTPDSVWYMFAAISVHKLVLAFCVGMELLVAGTRPLLSGLYMFTFCIVSPIGIAIGTGISVSEEAVGPSLVSAILQGIACGTLVYVVFFEIMSTTHLGFATCLSLLLGFVLMFSVLQFDDDDDDQTCYAIPITDQADYTTLKLA